MLCIASKVWSPFSCQAHTAYVAVVIGCIRAMRILLPALVDADVHGILLNALTSSVFACFVHRSKGFQCSQPLHTALTHALAATYQVPPFLVVRRHRGIHETGSVIQGLQQQCGADQGNQICSKGWEGFWCQQCATDKPAGAANTGAVESCRAV